MRMLVVPISSASSLSLPGSGRGGSTAMDLISTLGATGWRATGQKLSAAPTPTSSKIARFPDLSHKSVAAPRNRDEVMMVIRTFAQRFPQGRDIARQVSFLDEVLRPDLFHQFFFCQRASAVCDENQQDVEDPGCELHDFAVAIEQPLIRV